MCKVTVMIRTEEDFGSDDSRTNEIRISRTIAHEDAVTYCNIAQLLRDASIGLGYADSTVSKYLDENVYN
jgi:hypothetical protein